MELPKVYSGMLHFNGNLLCAIDLETTGVRPGFHEIIQIAILPLNADIRPIKDIRPFYTTVKPNYPERAEKGATAKHRLQINDLLLSAPESDKVVDLLCEWVEGLKLPMNKAIMPLAHNWAFESSFLKAWLGVSLMDQIFHAHARDSMTLAVSINDKAFLACEEHPFSSVSLAHICNKLGIINHNAHDALSDCIAESEVYRTLLQLHL